MGMEIKLDEYDNNELYSIIDDTDNTSQIVVIHKYQNSITVLSSPKSTASSLSTLQGKIRITKYIDGCRFYLYWDVNSMEWKFATSNMLLGGRGHQTDPHKKLLRKRIYDSLRLAGLNQSFHFSSFIKTRTYEFVLSFHEIPQLYLISFLDTAPTDIQFVSGFTKDNNSISEIITYWPGIQFPPIIYDDVYYSPFLIHYAQKQQSENASLPHQQHLLHSHEHSIQSIMIYSYQTQHFYHISALQEKKIEISPVVIFQWACFIYIGKVEEFLHFNPIWEHMYHYLNIEWHKMCCHIAGLYDEYYSRPFTSIVVSAIELKYIQEIHRVYNSTCVSINDIKYIILSKMEPLELTEIMTTLLT